MRYGTVRKYPIMHSKKSNPPQGREPIAELSLGAAAGLLAVVFAGGMLWGCMIKKVASPPLFR